MSAFDRSYHAAGVDLTEPALYAPAMGDPAAPLPQVAVGSPIFTLLEDAAVWTQGWACIGTRHAIPNPGDLLPYTIGVQGIHVEHRPGGQLIGRFNKAPHGGCRFVPLQCQTGHKTSCSFTSCGYSRDRRPMTVTDDVASHQYLGLRPERLVPVPVETAGPLILVNLGEPTLLPRSALLRHPMLDVAANAAETWREQPLAWWDVVSALVGNAEVRSADPWLVSHLRLAQGRVELRWLFPNLVLLLRDSAACVILLQPTDLRQTLLRITQFGDVVDWPAELDQRLQAPASGGAAQRFLRACFADRIARRRNGEGEVRSHA